MKSRWIRRREKRAAWSFVDTETGKTYEARGKAVVLAASTLESARLMLLSKSRTYPNGIGNSSGHVGHNLCEHTDGPARHGPGEGSGWQARARWMTGGPGDFTFRGSAI